MLEGKCIMKRKKNNRIWTGEFKLKVVEDILKNDLSYSQAARKYNFYLKSGTLNDTLPARWTYQYQLYGKERLLQTPKDYREYRARRFPKLTEEDKKDYELRIRHLEMELEYTKKLQALIQKKKEQTKRNTK